MKITTGKIPGPQKVVVYGPEGIGKTTFAAEFPKPLFIDTEGSTKHIDVARLDAPTSWAMLIQQVKWFIANRGEFETLVIDTADWAEALAIDFVVSRASKKSIEDFGYGKGFTFVYEEFGELLNLLTEVIGAGANVVLTAHSQIKKFEQPDTMDAYDRFELKLSKKTAAMVKEWADVVLFANYEIIVVAPAGGQGKSKAQGGKRVMYTSHTPAWDAKNRHGLDAKLDFEYAAIAPVIEFKTATPKPAQAAKAGKAAKASAAPQKDAAAEYEPSEGVAYGARETVEVPQDFSDTTRLAPLADMMKIGGVTAQEIMEATARKGYYPVDTPIANYDQSYIDGVLIGAFEQVKADIINHREGN